MAVGLLYDNKTVNFRTWGFLGSSFQKNNTDSGATSCLSLYEIFS